jgi:hypothetical protein
MAAITSRGVIVHAAHEKRNYPGGMRSVEVSADPDGGGVSV